MDIPDDLGEPTCYPTRIEKRKGAASFAAPHHTMKETYNPPAD
jgi:hypothetical protein